MGNGIGSREAQLKQGRKEQGKRIEPVCQGPFEQGNRRSQEMSMFAQPTTSPEKY